MFQLQISIIFGKCVFGIEGILYQALTFSNIVSTGHTNNLFTRQVLLLIGATGMYKHGVPEIRNMFRKM